MNELILRARVFKTAWFSKAARKSHISDQDLCAAIHQVIQGQADDLGGGVFKKRLNDNMYRSIILAKGGRFWVYEFYLPRRIGTISRITNLPRSARLRSCMSG